MASSVWILFTLCVGTLAKEHVPVVIWGNYGQPRTETHVSGLSKIRTFAFSQILHNLVTHRPHIILFSEENLSVEDFSWMDEDDGAAFPHLRNMSQTSEEFLYLPSVEAAVAGFHQLTHYGYTVANYDEESPQIVSSPTIFKVKLREPEPMEDRVSFLRAHDKDIRRIYEDAMDKYKKVLCAYTGKHASFVAPVVGRHRREVGTEDVDDIVMNDNDKTIYIVAAAPLELRKGDNVTTYLTKVILATKDVKGDAVILDVKFKEDATSLDFQFAAGVNQAWKLESVEVEGTNVKMTSKQPIGAPAGYSYFCAQNVTFKGVSADGYVYMLTMQNLQVQPHVVERAFGPASDCIPYFSAQIWSGLLVCFFLMGIAIMSILFILDIHTNDRFDDPKSKTITISNTE